MGPRDLITQSPRSHLLNPGLSWDEGVSGHGHLTLDAFLSCLIGNLGAKVGVSAESVGCTPAGGMPAG